MVQPSSSEQAGREGTRAAPGAPGAEGRVLGGRYRLLRQLGSGGMGSVWLCEHVSLGRRYALKVLNADRAADPELVERFLQEARSASRITQENVVDVIDFGQDAGGDHYYVMEALDGRSLAQLLREDGPLPVGRALALLEQVCRALAAAHGGGVVHRDVKPDNVLVERLPDGGERAKLIDFGISHASGNDRLTRDGEVIGTPEYMSPEQASGEEVSALTDVYAAGVLAYELLTGGLPLLGPTAIATLVAHQTQEPVAPGRRRPGLGPEVDRLVLRALAKKPADRFPSMQAMASEVMRVRVLLQLSSSEAPLPPRRGQSSTLPLPVTPTPRSGPARRGRAGRGLAFGLAGAALILLGATLAALLWSRGGAKVRPPRTPNQAVGQPAAGQPAAEEPPPPVVPRSVDDEKPVTERAARPPRPRPAAEPARDPYAPTDPLKADPFK